MHSCSLHQRAKLRYNRRIATQPQQEHGIMGKQFICLVFFLLTLPQISTIKAINSIHLHKAAERDKEDIHVRVILLLQMLIFSRFVSRVSEVRYLPWRLWKACLVTEDRRVMWYDIFFCSLWWLTTISRTLRSSETKLRERKSNSFPRLTLWRYKSRVCSEAYLFGTEWQVRLSCSEVG